MISTTSILNFRIFVVQIRLFKFDSLTTKSTGSGCSLPWRVLIWKCQLTQNNREINGKPYRTSWNFWSCWHATNFPAHYLKAWSTKFLGDCYFKSFPAIESIYEGEKVEKRECISLVQKRVEVMLKNSKKNVKEGI